MLNNLGLPDGLSIRPSRPSDQPFLNRLYHSTRDDLRLVDAEQDFIESLIEQQQGAQSVGYGDMFPNAMYFIVEKQSEAIGRITIDFGSTEIRLVDITLIKQAQGKGYGRGIIAGLQLAAAKVRAPLVLSVHASNFSAKKLYTSLGFIVEELTAPYERMIWYPSSECIGA